MPEPLRRGEIVRIRDERWSVARHQQGADVTILDVCGCDRTNRGIRTRFLLPFEQIDRLPAQASMRIVSRRRWRHRARHVLAAAVPRYDSLRCLAGARIDLLAFQLEPALAVVAGRAARILIADDVGLGKTVQAGLIAAETLTRDGDARVLVICPASLRSQWHDELAARFALEAEHFDSSSLARLATELPPGINPWAAHRLIVTSIDYVKRPDVLRALEAIIWDLVIVDEAHHLAGTSDRHAAAALLAARARTLVMLTATPHSGDEAAFRRLCAVGDLGERFPLALFRRRRRDAGPAPGRRTLWLDVRLDAAELAMHGALLRYARLVWRESSGRSGARLAMAVLLRRAASSAGALARSIERRLALLSARATGDVAPWFAAASQPALPFDADGGDDDEPDAQLAEPGLADAASERRRLEAILDLARTATGREGKLRVLRTLLRRSPEPAIVFTEYRDTLAMLAAALAPFGCDVLHGGMLDDERQRALQGFTSGATRVLLATDAAGEGLNLHARCRLVVNLEVPWTPVRVEQRVGRVDRIGQRRRVHQVMLVAGGTPEQGTVADRLRHRAARAAQTFAALEPEPADERELAGRILGDDPVTPGESPGPDLPAGVFVPDLRAQAAIEAARAASARRMAPDGAGVHAPLGPFAAAVVRRPARACWAYRLSLGAPPDAVLWETLLAATCAVVPLRCAAAADVAAILETGRRIVEPVLAAERQERVAGDLDRLRVATAAAIARERAMALELERRQARLAATLIQQGLFDRRVERDTTSRREVLGAAIDACRARLARLERSTRAAAAIDPVFAVLLP